MTPTTAQLHEQFLRIQGNGQLDALNAASDAAKIPRGLHVAIASRETNCTNELGDYQGGEYHGVGLTQIDIQHDIARKARDDGNYKTLEGLRLLLEFGADLLAENIASVAAYFDDVTGDAALKIAASGYNCGVERALRAADEGGDSDAHTTGKDYGVDVMRRKAYFDSVMGS